MGQARTPEEIRFLVTAIFRTWRGWVMSTVHKGCLNTILSSHVEAIVQDVSSRLAVKLGQGDLPDLTIDNVDDEEMRGPILAWLKTAARFVRYEYYRREKRWQDHLNQLQTDVKTDVREIDPLESILDEFSREMLRSAIPFLPPRMREAVLFNQAGISNSEIARRMGVTSQTVRGYLSRAAKKLRQRFRRLDQD